MIIVLKPHATPEVVDHVLERITALGFTPHLSQGVSRTIIGVIGDEAKLQVEPLQAIPGVEQVVPILKPFKLASREFHPEGSVFEAKGVKIGGGHLAVIAGPCAIESEAILFEIAGRVRDAGANILRGGAFKPRTSPYSFQGLGRDGLKILQAAGERFGMPVVTEVMDPRQVEMVERYTDILQVGARNMQNFDLLKECGRTRVPILLKRGMSATVKDLLMSAEYVLSEGNRQVILCERGIRTFEDSTRNTLDLSIVPNIQGQSHLPIIVDPSHATGPARPDPGDGAGRGGLGRRRDPHRSSFVPGAGSLGRASGPGSRPVRPAHGRNPPARGAARVRRSTSAKENRWHAHLADRGQLEDEPGDACRGGRAGRRGQGGSRPGDERARRSLSAGCLSRRGRLGPGRHADRPGRPEHALGAGGCVYRRGFRRRCSSTPGARM